MPLLFVVKVKRPRSEVRGKASLDLGGGKAVKVCHGSSCSGLACRGLLRRSRCGEFWRRGSRNGQAVELRLVVMRSGRAWRSRPVMLGRCPVRLVEFRRSWCGLDCCGNARRSRCVKERRGRFRCGGLGRAARGKVWLVTAVEVRLGMARFGAARSGGQVAACYVQVCCVQSVTASRVQARCGGLRRGGHGSAGQSLEC